MELMAPPFASPEDGRCDRHPREREGTADDDGAGDCDLLHVRVLSVSVRPSERAAQAHVAPIVAAASPPAIRASQRRSDDDSVKQADGRGRNP